MIHSDDEKKPIAEKKVREFDIGVRVKTRNYQIQKVGEMLGKKPYSSEMFINRYTRNRIYNSARDNQ